MNEAILGDDNKKSIPAKIGKHDVTNVLLPEDDENVDYTKHNHRKKPAPKESVSALMEVVTDAEGRVVHNEKGFQL